MTQQANPQDFQQPQSQPHAPPGLESDMAETLRAVNGLRREYAKQHTLTAEGIRFGAYMTGVFAVVLGASLTANAIINRGAPELPAGPKK